MADPRVQQARERAEESLEWHAAHEEGMFDIYDAPAEFHGLVKTDRQAAEDVLFLADWVAALETALRFVRPEFAQADNVESWHWGHVKRGEPYAEDCGLCIIDAALVGSGTEPAPAEGSA